jgi:hypothetical protein
VASTSAFINTSGLRCAIAASTMPAPWFTDPVISIRASMLTARASSSGSVVMAGSALARLRSRAARSSTATAPSRPAKA